MARLTLYTVARKVERLRFTQMAYLHMRMTAVKTNDPKDIADADMALEILTTEANDFDALISNILKDF